MYRNVTNPMYNSTEKTLISTQYIEQEGNSGQQVGKKGRKLFGNSRKRFSSPPFPLLFQASLPISRARLAVVRRVVASSPSSELERTNTGERRRLQQSSVSPLSLRTRLSFFPLPHLSLDPLARREGEASVKMGEGRRRRCFSPLVS